MRYVDFHGFSMSTIVMGTDKFGDSIPEEIALEELDYYVSQGGNVIDSAHLYGQKRAGMPSSSENCLGQWLQGVDRSSLFLITKGCCPEKEHWHERRTDLAPMRVDIEQSMESLKGPVDLWFFHRDNPEVPADELIDMAYAEIVDRGYAKMLGASNWTGARIEKANEWARKNGREGFLMSEIQASLASSTPEMWDDDTLVCMNETEEAWYRTHSLPLLAFSSQAKGYFSKLLGGSVMKQKNLNRFDTKENREKLPRVRKLCDELGVSPAAVVLAYLQSLDYQILPIIGSSKPEQIRDSLKNADLRLDKSQVAFLKGEEK